MKPQDDQSVSVYRFNGPVPAVGAEAGDPAGAGEVRTPGDAQGLR